MFERLLLLPTMQWKKESLVMHENEVWKLVDIPENNTPVKCECVFKEKYNLYGVIYNIKLD